MGEPETVAAAIPTQRTERPIPMRSGQAVSVLERIEKAAERVNAIAAKFAGPKLHPGSGGEQKRGAGRLLDALERELTALEECL